MCRTLHTTVRPHSAAPAAVLALAIGAGTGCATADTPVLWSGRLVDDPLWVGGIESLEGGSLGARDASGALLAEAEPVEDWAGGFALQVDPGSALALVVQTSGYTTTVWPTEAPEGDAIWLDGALYPRADMVLSTLAADHLPSAPLPGAGATAGLWVEPDPTGAWGEGLVEIDVDGAARADLRLSPTGRWTLAADGVPDVILFLNVPPGPVKVRPLPTSGAGPAISLHLEAGELGMLPRLTP